LGEAVTDFSPEISAFGEMAEIDEVMAWCKVRKIVPGGDTSVRRRSKTAGALRGDQTIPEGYSRIRNGVARW